MRLQTSPDLVNWTVVDTASAARSTIPGEPLVQSVTLAVSASAARAFYRLSIGP